MTFTLTRISKDVWNKMKEGVSIQDLLHYPECWHAEILDIYFLEGDKSYTLSMNTEMINHCEICQGYYHVSKTDLRVMYDKVAELAKLNMKVESAFLHIYHCLATDDIDRWRKIRDKVRADPELRVEVTNRIRMADEITQLTPYEVESFMRYYYGSRSIAKLNQSEEVQLSIDIGSDELALCGGSSDISVLMNLKYIYNTVDFEKYSLVAQTR
ncbi:hypothetical protein C3I27_04260 [Campylobacter jejuni]|uniref:Uncharacterized protein n=1 Tax=Campylobacter jejuni TaxID=197 RepID=A0AAX1Z4Y5_CAMJU|nr:hypothetical protein [Campylobacter jejuni]RTI48642.1 hypothetical protein C3I27_04260 [Campylobacter jejuni]